MAEPNTNPTQQRLPGLPPPSLAGQWFGEITGSNTGFVRMDVDHDRPELVAIHVSDNTHPFACDGVIRQTNDLFEIELAGFSAPLPPPPAITLPSTGKVQVTLAGDLISGTWNTNANTAGTISAQKIGQPVAGNATNQLTWHQFRDWVLDKQPTGYLFRGHSLNSFPLITSFHRTGRRNLRRYVREDLPELRRWIESHLCDRFPEGDPSENGCLLAIAQHHGFPTPLLDWTTSPFIAAYFALVWPGAAERAPDSMARLFVFDPNGWEYGAGATLAWDEPQVRLAPMNFPARHNPRLLPQQSVSVFSNIVDIDGFLGLAQDQERRQRLWRVDIPVAEAAAAKRDLASMGITAGSLFPGLEGICRGLAEKRFW